jgi:ABC-type dipeptide/oligopeptide/nickel transport system permease subunit
LQNLGNFLRRKPLGAFGAGVALLIVVVAIFAPFIATHDPYNIDPFNQYAAPSSELWFGGDQLGRDIYSRIVYGTRISLVVGIISALIGSSVGMLIAVSSAYFGGMTDLLSQRVMDGMMAFPALILAIAIMAALGASLTNVIIALTVVYIPSTARILRSQALAIKEMDYVLAARSVGAGHWRVMLYHMVPNCLAVFIVIITFQLGIAIIAEATLSFLGIGAPPPRPLMGRYVAGVGSNLHCRGPLAGGIPGDSHCCRCVLLECARRCPAGRI